MGDESNPDWRFQITKEGGAVFHLREHLLDAVVTPLHTQQQRQIIYEKIGLVCAVMNRSYEKDKQLAKYKELKKRLNGSEDDHFQKIDRLVKVLVDCREFFLRHQGNTDCQKLVRDVMDSVNDFIPTKNGAVLPVSDRGQDISSQLGLGHEPA